MTLPDLTPLQAILLLDALEAIAHTIADQYRDDIGHYWRTAHPHDDDEADHHRAGPVTPAAPPSASTTTNSPLDPSPF